MHLVIFYVVDISLPPKIVRGSSIAVKITWYQRGTYDQDIEAFSKPIANNRQPAPSGARAFSPAINAARAPAITETMEPRIICMRSMVVSAVNGDPSWPFLMASSNAR